MNGSFTFTEHTTDKGLTLHLCTLPHAHTVSLGVLTLVGTRDEQWPDEAGLAHAHEHMLLQGTDGFPTQRAHAERIELIGGIINAWTNKEGTFHWVQVPAEHCERAFESCSERVRMPIFPEEKIGTEMSNIVQEIRRIHDNPAQNACRLALEFLYRNHPLGRDTLGTEESVMEFTRPDFIEFHERFYHTANFSCVVVGSISIDDAMRYCDVYFPDMATRPKSSRALVPLASPISERELIVPREIEQAHIVLAAVTPGSRVDRRVAWHLACFSSVLGEGIASPLFQRVRNELGLCYQIGAGATSWSDVGNFTIYLGTDMKRMRGAIASVEATIESAVLDEERFRNTIEMTVGSIALSTEDTLHVLNHAVADILFDGRARGYDDVVSEIRGTSQDVMRSAVRQYLKPEDMRRVVVCPK